MIKGAGESRLFKRLLDSLDLVNFKAPLHTAIIAFSGTSTAGLIGAALMLLLGRPYEALLNGVRNMLGLPPI